MNQCRKTYGQQGCALWTKNECKVSEELALAEPLETNVGAIKTCSTNKFGKNFCHDWCNTDCKWGCGEATLFGSDPRNTDNVDYTCNCDQCNSHGLWGCGIATLAGGDNRNKDNVDYTCSCKGCNSCTRASEELSVGDFAAMAKEPSTAFSYVKLAAIFGLGAAFAYVVSETRSKGDGVHARLLEGEMEL